MFALDELVRLADMFKLPDMVLIVGSDDDPLVEGPSANGLIPPIFKTSSSKAAYDLILPDCYPDHSPGECVLFFSYLKLSKSLSQLVPTPWQV